ncbi:MAG TPA: flagellar hook-length control protein FliK, partial [Bacillota bacterium]|nr:flagellar hook-length control protein FliK [Bacillota bacterium]
PEASLSAPSGGGVGLGMTSGVWGRGIDSRLAEERPMGVEQEGVSHGSDGVDWAGTSNPKGIGGADEGKPERAELTEVESGAKARAGHGVSSRLHSDAEAAVSTAGSKLEAWRIQIADSQSMAERATSDAGLIKSDGFGVRPAGRQNIVSGMDEGEESLAAREEADGADAADGESVLRVRVPEPDVTMRRDNTSSDMQSDARSRERSHGSREVVFEPRRESAQSGSEQIGHSDNGLVGFEGLVANLEAVNTGAAPTEGVPIDGRNRISDEAGRSMMRQIAAHIEARRGVGSGEFRAKLVPESLGEVRIRIKVQGGVCTATIRVGDSEVGEYIEEHGTDLKVLLAESGIDLADLSVSVGSHSTSEGAREWTQGQYAAAAFAGGGRRGRKDYAPVEEWFCNSHRNELAPQEIELAAAYARSGHGRIDYFA